MSNYKLSNKGIKVGDIFHCSWGYDQTNNTFFRVEKLRGKTQVLLKEVALGYKSSEEGFMSENREYNTKDWEYRKMSVFINDNKKGMPAVVKRQEDGSFVHIFLKGHYLLTPYHNEKVYESWYA